MDIRGLLRAILDNKNRWVISFIIGLGFSLFFLNKCMYGRCIVVRGPSKEKIKDRIFKVGDSCMTFHPVVSVCDSDSYADTIPNSNPNSNTNTSNDNSGSLGVIE